MITLIGFVLMLFSLLLVMVYCPDLATPLPPLFYYTYSSRSAATNAARQLCRMHLGVLDPRQLRREAGAAHRHVQPARRAL